MRAVALLYHDVVEPGHSTESGFTSSDAEIYKLSVADFERHLDALASAGRAPASSIGSADTVLLTFDDGGASATRTADLLDRRGWKGYFFITTDYIGESRFVDGAAIRELHGRGHIVGSHSCSHPPRISHLSDSELEQEWSGSVQALQDILGERVTVASVPGGFYSRRVAEFAARAGVRTLFNSEPVTRPTKVNDCTVWGRFGLQCDSPPERARAFATLDQGLLLREAAFWNTKKLIKAAGGEQWLAFRRWWLAR